MKNLTITKSNKIVEGAYRLTLSEQRVLLGCIAQIHSRPGTPAITHETTFEVSANGIADLAGIPQKQAYDVLVGAAEKLADRWIVINTPDPSEPWEKLKARWVDSIGYRESTGTIWLRFGGSVLPYLTQLSREFTSYKLRHVSRMTSVYAIRLYELLMQWEGAGEREVELDWFKEQFQIPDKYHRMFDLKKRVIQPAVDQINEHSNLWVTWGQRKCGRAVTHIQFSFGEKLQKSIPESFVPQELSPPPQEQKQVDPQITELIASVAIHGIQPQTVLAAIKRHGLEGAIGSRDYALKSIERKSTTDQPVGDPGGYIARCFKRGWGISTPEQKAAQARIEADKQAQQELAINKQRFNQLNDEVNKIRKIQLKELMAELSTQREKELKNEFVRDGLPDVMRPVYALKGWKGPGVLAVYRAWLARLLLPSFEDDLKALAETKGIDISINNQSSSPIAALK